jgi:DNA-binding CsgD family transcriptional regulator
MSQKLPAPLEPIGIYWELARPRPRVSCPRCKSEKRDRRHCWRCGINLCSICGKKLENSDGFCWNCCAWPCEKCGFHSVEACVCWRYDIYRCECGELRSASEWWECWSRAHQVIWAMKRIEPPMIEDNRGIDKLLIKGFVARPCPGRPQRPLTETEREIIISWVLNSDLSDKEQQAALGMSRSAYRDNTAAICRKLGATNQQHAVTIILTSLIPRGQPPIDLQEE